jgi:GntR family transcriptional regulator / MocR family aminotransferase
VEAVLRLDPTLPRSRAVEAVIRDAITRGALPQGSRLPSSRELAAELGVARNTVVAAVDDLVAEGVLEARPRSGVYVARRTRPVPPAGTATVAPQPRFDLRPGRPEQGSFPVARWTAATKRAAAGLDRAPVDEAGSLELRTELAAYLARARGVETTAESILVCAGFRAASGLLAVALASLGARSVAIEDPSLPGMARAWQLAGLAVTDLPVDDRGAEVERLAADPDVAAVVLTPSHQFPLGGALSPERRQLVIDWAQATGGYVVEDDYDGEFRFDRRPVVALQRSAPDRVVYAGSTSKTLDPTLRLGWLVLPPELVGPLTAASEALAGGVPLLNQLALADLIARGEYERHIRRQRREYARRRALLHRAIGELGLATPGISAGLHAVIALDERHRDAQRAGLAEHGVAVHELRRYTRGGERDPAVVVGFGTPSRARFGAALEALTTALGSPDDRSG